LLAGLAFGLAILVRLPVVLMLPGLLLLSGPAGWRERRKDALVAFGCGVLLGGVLPVLAHQQRLTGAWYSPTYGTADSAPPTLAAVRQNLSFYLGTGPGSTYNWALLTMLVGCLGLGLWTGRGAAFASATPQSARARSRWRRLVLAALLTWGVPAGYFLTHAVVAHFYSIPATFGTALLLALGAFAIERDAAAGGRDYGARLRRPLQAGALILALTPGAVAVGRAWANYIPATDETRPRQFVLPAELADEHAWLWADSLTGTIWYYARRPAYKIPFSDADARALAYQLAWRRGEPQYVIRDSTDMQSVLDEIGRLGGTLEPRGQVDQAPYFLIHWPHGGPRTDGADARFH
jgi:4-amino-4-deoxy-L-arabinose transferase-like glycosyltransferase